MNTDYKKANAVDKALFWFAHTSRASIATICALMVITIQLIALALSSNIALLITPTQVHYLSSTSAQVAAALFGLTVAGYSFFASNKLPNRLEESDDKELFGEIARGYHAELVILAVSCLFAIVFMIANIIIDSTTLTERLQDYVLNSSILWLLAFIIALFIFVIQVVDPDRLQKHSSIAKSRDFPANYEFVPTAIGGHQTDSTKEAPVKTVVDSLPVDNTGEFLGLFNMINHELRRFADGNSFLDNRSPSMGATLRVMRENSQISDSWYEVLNDLRRYRNYIVHDLNGEPPSQEACDNARNILSKMKSANNLLGNTGIRRHRPNK